MGDTATVKQAAPPPPPPSPNDANTAAAMNAAGQEAKKARGRAATLLTGSTGLMNPATVSQRTLLGA